MKIRRMGRTGLRVTEICLGTMTFGHQCDERTSFAILDKAAEHGVTFIDTADVYPVPPSPETAGRTEEFVGNWLKGQRDKFVLATKCRQRVGHGPNDEGQRKVEPKRISRQSGRSGGGGAMEPTMALTAAGKSAESSWSNPRLSRSVSFPRRATEQMNPRVVCRA